MSQTNEPTDPSADRLKDPLLDPLFDPPSGGTATPAPRRAFFALSPNTTAPTEVLQSPSPPLAAAHAEAARDEVTRGEVANSETEPLPLLTDIVSDPVVGHAAAPTAAADAAALRRELACWLAEELPAAVLQVTDGIADQLVKEITDRAENQLLPRLLARLDTTD